MPADDTPPLGRRRRRASRTGRLLWMLSAVFIVYGTSIPFHFSWNLDAAAAKLADVPRALPIGPGQRVSIPDTVQNILLFVPFGAFGAVALRGRYRKLWRVALVTVSGTALSASVETLQLFTTDRTSSLNDLATNTTGSLVGALLALEAVAVIRRILLVLSTRGLAHSTALYPVLLLLAILPLAAWTPLDASLDVGEIGRKLRSLAADPWQFERLADEGMNFLYFALFGGALTVWLGDVRIRRPALVALVVGVAVAVALEVSQLIIASRMPGLKDLLVHAAGVSAGATLARVEILQRRPGVGATLVVMGCWIGAALMVLSPFEWAAARRPFMWVPFLSYYGFTSVQTVTHVTELMMTLLPAGFVVAAVAGRGSFVMVGIGAAGLVAPLEYLQGLVVGRYSDVTDIAMVSLGAVVGAWLAGPGRDRFSRELQRRKRSDHRSRERAAQRIEAPAAGWVPRRDSPSNWQPRFERVPQRPPDGPA